ncbi:MAG: ABC exporter membrane fusion protein [Cyanobacteria bacterium P01_A01_bin.17]
MVPGSVKASSSAAKPARRYGLPLVIVAAFSVGAIASYTIRQVQRSEPEAPIAEVKQFARQTVTALGRLEPKGEIVKLSAPSSTASNRVEQLLVKEGDRVTAGQVIAILDSRDRLQASVLEAQERVRVAEAELARVKAGAKQGEISAQRAEINRLAAQQQGTVDAQKATVSRLEAELQNATAEASRYQNLYAQGAISTSERDSRRLTQQTAEQQLREAKAVLSRLQTTRSPEIDQARANLERIAEVRPVDIQVAQASVNQSIAAVKQAQAQLDQAYVRASQSGTVLEIHTRPGEVVSEDGIVEIGQTRTMYAVAEVYQSDIQHVQPGQKVKVTSDSLAGELQGTVDWIDAKVQRQNVVNADPSSNIDARVVEVHVQLDPASSEKAEKFTNLQVQAEINL